MIHLIAVASNFSIDMLLNLAQIGITMIHPKHY